MFQTRGRKEALKTNPISAQNKMISATKDTVRGNWLMWETQWDEYFPFLLPPPPSPSAFMVPPDEVCFCSQLVSDSSSTCKSITCTTLVCPCLLKATQIFHDVWLTLGGLEDCANYDCYQPKSIPGVIRDENTAELNKYYWLRIHWWYISICFFPQSALRKVASCL